MIQKNDSTKRTLQHSAADRERHILDCRGDKKMLSHRVKPMAQHHALYLIPKVRHDTP